MIGPILIPADAIRRRVVALAVELDDRLRGVEQPLCIGLMDGALPFVADLIRCLPWPDLDVRLVSARSYRGTVSTGSVTMGTFPEVAGRTVILLDDILDTGRTLAAARSAIQAGGATRVLTCVLLDKPARRQAEGLAQADLVGFTIPDHFVIGYGLDLDGRYRHLPDIRIAGS